MKMLVPVDGSEPSNRAVDYAIAQAGRLKEDVEVHLLNVQHHVSGLVSSFVSGEQIRQYRQEEGSAALRPAMQKLDAAGIGHRHHIGVGNEPDVIVEYAREHGCDEIVMGTRGLGSVSGMVLGSVATKVVYLSPVPVVLVK